MAEITGTSGPVTKIDVLGGVPGAAGVSVTTAELDADGHLLIGKSNGTTIDVGKVKFDVTPEVQAAWDGAVAAETEATTQAGIATTMAGQTVALQDEAISSIVNTPSSITRAAVDAASSAAGAEAATAAIAQNPQVAQAAADAVAGKLAAAQVVVSLGSSGDTDLNSIMEIGVYRPDDSAANLPLSGVSGTLEVVRAGNVILQRFTTWENVPRMYVRRWNTPSSVWSEWRNMDTLWTVGASTVDLDTLTAPGAYDPAMASPNLPVAVRGILEVFTVSPSVMQRFTTWEAEPQTYLRRYSQPSATWGPWARLALGSEVTPLAQSLGATGVSGGTPANRMPIRALLARARAGVGLCQINYLGDSIVRGVNSTTVPQSEAHPNVLHRLLIDRGVPSGGAGVVVMHPDILTRIPDARFAFTGTWTVDVAAIGKRWAAKGSTGASVLFTDVEKATTVRVHCYNGSGNPATVKIDGVAVGTITPVAGSGITTAAFTGLSDTQHTVEVILTGSSFTLAAIETRRGSGVIVNNFGDSGSSTAGWTGMSDLVDSFAIPDPVVTIIALGTNNALRAIDSGGSTPDKYKTELAALVARWSARGPVLLVAPPPLASTSSGYPLHAYTAAAHAVASDAGIPILDMTTRWVDHATATTAGMFVAGDTVHPHLAGHQDYAQADLDLLGL